MDKNVSGVDLEELMKAREELDKERGVDTDPNMYSDYNPNRKADETSLDQNEESIDQPVDENLQNLESVGNDFNENSNVNGYQEVTPIEEIKSENVESVETNNLSKFDMFSAFEVKENVHSEEQTQQVVQPIEQMQEQTQQVEKQSEQDSVNLLGELDSSLDTSNQNSETNNSDEKIENLAELGELIDDIMKDIETDADILNDNNTVNEPSVAPNINVDASFENQQETQSVENVNTASNTENQVESVVENNETTENIQQPQTEEFRVFDGSVNEQIDTINREMETIQAAEPVAPVVMENSNSINETEVITDFNQLKNILQKELEKSNIAEEEKIEEVIEIPEVPESKYEKIEDFKFLNEIASDEFKTSDKLSYIIGKNEKGEIVYGNFKEHYNLAVFGKNESVTNLFINSMMLSLCLKNTVQDVNFVLLDSNINSTFEVYNKSSYLFFNRIAKTNKEIADTLIEVTKEIEERYNKLASFGVKNIDQYNQIAVESENTIMPYVIVVFNNYTKASQATDNDKINACLYQILKFGRIVGINAMVVAKLPISISQINYNLSSRISFKCDEDSRYTVGVEGAETLPEDADAIYLNISSNDAEHIKIPTLSDTELELIISDLEE